MKGNLKANIAIVLATCLIGITLSSVLIPQAYFAKKDFPQYWSAYRLIQAGENPYQSELMKDIQLAVGNKSDRPTMMWNPPWTPYLLSPVLALDFETSSRLWMVISFILLGICASVFTRTLPEKKISLTFLVFAGLFFTPFWSNIIAGQIGMVLAFGCSLLYFGLVKKIRGLAGIACILLSLKPHILFLPVFTVFCASLPGRKQKPLYLLDWVIIFSFFGGYAVTHKELILFWIESLAGASLETSIQPGIVNWIPSSIPGILRTIIPWDNGLELYLCQFLVPGLAMTGCLLTLMRQDTPDWSTLFPVLICLSVLLSPYGWISDQCVMLPVLWNLLYTGTPLSTRRKVTTALTLLLLGFWMFFFFMVVEFHHQLWWPPLIMLFLLCLQKSRTAGS